MEHTDSKTKNSLKNIQVSLISYGVISLLSFLNRTVFIHMLSQEYLGYSGLFSNILNILSFAELGVGSAMNVAMYEPIHKKNIPVLQSMMKTYRRIYTMVGLIILVMGFAVLPFLSYFIKDFPKQFSMIHLYFALYVINSSVSYFFVYKRSLITCHQMEYIPNKISMWMKVGLNAVQIVGLYLTRNYTLYLSVAIVFTILENVFVSRAADKLFPYLKVKNKQVLSLKHKNILKQNILAMIRHKIATIIVYSTDNLIISKFVGLISVGLYSNYVLILNIVSGFINKIFSSLSASVGLLSVSDDKDYVEKVLYGMLTINFLIYAWCGIVFFCLVQPFIQLWAGKEYVLDLFTVFIITINFYFAGMRRTVLLFWEGSGMFYYDKIKPIAESIANLVLSLILVQYLGIAGVLLGTVLSMVGICFWWEAAILFKHYFHKSVLHYLFVQCLYLGIALILGAFTYFISSGFSIHISAFILRMLVCFSVPAILLLILFYRSKNFRFVLQKIKQ